LTGRNLVSTFGARGGLVLRKRLVIAACIVVAITAILVVASDPTLAPFIYGR
jgi:hypothetical protein